MKLVSFSVTNYRSITKAHKISLGQYTVLLGKNNEGKSNISNALNCAMNILLAHSKMTRVRYNREYNWIRDFPIQLQSGKRNLQSNWQTPTEVVNYVRENLEFMGEVSIYEVYR